MSLEQLLRQRRMCRSFTGTPVALSVLRPLAETALRSPTAGNSAGVRITLLGQQRLEEYFAVATDASWRATSRRWPQLSRAGAVALVTSRPDDYAERYAAPDKARSGLDVLENWPVPYWHTDAAMATMSFLLLLEEHGLGATMWGNFRHEADVAAMAGLNNESLFAAVLIGEKEGNDLRSASLDRSVPSRAERVRCLD